MRGGSLWGLRPELGPGKPWTSDRPERLGLVTPPRRDAGLAVDTREARPASRWASSSQGLRVSHTDLTDCVERAGKSGPDLDVSALPGKREPLWTVFRSLGVKGSQVQILSSRLVRVVGWSRFGDIRAGPDHVWGRRPRPAPAGDDGGARKGVRGARNPCTGRSRPRRRSDHEVGYLSRSGCRQPAPASGAGDPGFPRPRPGSIMARRYLTEGCSHQSEPTTVVGQSQRIGAHQHAPRARNPSPYRASGLVRFGVRVAM
ncbi:hypothetical protein SHIRM173S_02408 [Streptomyces hirsutus]